MVEFVTAVRGISNALPYLYRDADLEFLLSQTLI
jgi:hypothetical protein